MFWNLLTVVLMNATTSGSSVQPVTSSSTGCVPTLEKINPAKIPHELKQVLQWVTWKSVRRGEELTKIPFMPNGATASSTDPDTWSEFDDVIGEGSQPGFVFTPEDPYCGIDLDGCRNPESGKIADWAKEIIHAAKSYTEVSPSKTGVKIFARGSLPKNTKWNVDQEPVSDKKPGIELYDHDRYFAVTGWKLAGVPETVNDAQDAIDWLLTLNPRIQRPSAQRQVSEPTERDVTERARTYISRMPAAVSGQRGHDVTFRVACVAALGFGLNESDALALMHEYNERCEPKWSDRELEHKVASAMSQGGDRNYLRHAGRDEIYAVQVPRYEETTETAEPEKTPPAIVTNLHEAALAYLESLKSGTGSLIATGLPGLDDAIGGGVMPGEMFIMAGRPSHGKSAIALQAVHHWTSQGLPSMFVSEEMSSLSLGKRSLQFATSVNSDYWAASTKQVEMDCAVHFSGRAPCLIAESCRTTDRVIEVVERAVATEGVKCVVVDYAQLLGASGKSRYEQVTNVSVALRQLASSSKVVLMVLCQLSRAIEGRDSFLPRMSDLRETGQLEQDADVIVFNVWPWKVSPTEDKNRYQFFVCKNRNRAINRAVVDCRFEPSRQMILEYVSETEQAGRDWK